MKSVKRGKNTSVAEVIHVSTHGFWIFFEPQNREHFLPFRSFPWFMDATLRELSNIVVEHGHIVRWPDLDVDLDLERIEHPERFPLLAKVRRRAADAIARVGSR